MLFAEERVPWKIGAAPTARSSSLAATRPPGPWPPRRTVLVAVRHEKIRGKLVADIVIGREGKLDFGAYPENTVVLQAANRDQIRRAIGLDVDLDSIAGTTDLKSLIN